MKYFYFIQQNGNKNGPFDLSELRDQVIYHDQLVWRSDNENWKVASEFEELEGTYIFKPPPTPKERKAQKANEKFKKKIIENLFGLYIVASIILGFASYGIAKSSWQNYIKKTGGKYLGNDSKNRSTFVVSAQELMDNKRYPKYNPNLNNESFYAYGQSFLFKPFKVFGSTIYLTDKEQQNTDVLLGNLLLSSFASLFFLFVGIGIIYYLKLIL